MQLRILQQENSCYKILILWEIKAKRKRTTLKAVGAIPGDQDTWLSNDGYFAF